jgi:hypothetical protein
MLLNEVLLSGNKRIADFYTSNAAVRLHIRWTQVVIFLSDFHWVSRRFVVPFVKKAKRTDPEVARNQNGTNTNRLTTK